MKFTLAWLKRHLETDADVRLVADTLTRIGLEVEEIVDPRELLAPFRIARVLEAKPHPNADRLKVCLVDAGEGPVQVVCGAPNARAGMKGVFAPPGAYVPGTDLHLKPTKIRGVESRGMLCSEREMMLSDDHEGIIELPEDAPVGASFMEYAGLDDPVIDIAVTPNRPDALGVRGVARDLAAAGLGTLKDVPIASVPAAFPSELAIRIEDETACPAFAGRLIRGVTNGESPAWLKRLLEAVGLRPISVLVDITNFIMLDRARPLHVYDAAKVTGAITARRARPGETLLALDGRHYTCQGGECLIADARGPLGFGGVMGGEESGVTAQTTDVIVESALFDPVLTAETGRRHGIESDARYRFERGVDPESTLPGLELATRMILDLAGGEAGEVVLAGRIPDTRRQIAFNPGMTTRLGGLAVPESEQRTILERLGFGWQQAEKTANRTEDGRVFITVPSWRPDVEGEADLVEEVLRIAGYDRIPSAPLPRPTPVARPILTAAQKRVRLARRLLASRGLNEAVTWSFIDEKAATAFGAEPPLALANPIARQLACMRPSILPGLLQAAASNLARGVKEVALFELGPVYRGLDATDQEEVAGFLRAGRRHPPHWRDGEHAVDIFDIKADLFALLASLGFAPERLQTVEPASSWYHPGRSGRLMMGKGRVIAEFGEIHPKLRKQQDIAVPVVAAELFLDRLPPEKTGRRRARAAWRPNRLPSVERDFAFVVNEKVRAADLLGAVRKASPLIAEVLVFDRYQGPPLAEDEVSLALRVRLTPVDHTLTEAEIDEIASAIVAAATKAVGARLRG